jgi:hypothetical protein
MHFSSSWFRVVSMVRGKKRKRLEIKLGERGRWIHEKTSLINYRYNCDQEKRGVEWNM